MGELSGEGLGDPKGSWGSWGILGDPGGQSYQYAGFFYVMQIVFFSNKFNEMECSILSYIYWHVLYSISQVMTVLRVSLDWCWVANSFIDLSALGQNPEII